MTEEKKTYVTTELAGFYVAGRRVPAQYATGKEPRPTVGHEIELTEAEAAYDLSQGVIRLKEASKPLSKPSRETA